MTNIYTKLLAEFTDKLVHAFASDVASHELKKHMSEEEILGLINYANLVPDEEEVEEIELAKEDLPAGLGMGRAKKIIQLCQRGVSDGEYVHTGSQKIIIPTEQHNQMYRNEDSKLIGPTKDTEAIDFLAEKIGTVGLPKEEENAVARLPATWTGKNVEKLRKMIEECPKDKMVNISSNREVEFKVTKMVKCDDYRICAPRTEKQKFHSLVAYLCEQEDWNDIELSTKASPPKGKGGKKPAAKKPAAKKAAGKADKKKKVAEDEEATEEQKPKTGGRKKVVKEEVEEEEEEVKEKPKTGGRKKVVEEPEETEEDEDLKEDDDEEKDDGTASDDGEEETDEMDYEKIKEVREKLKEGEYVNVHNCKAVNKTAALSKTHNFNDDEHVCVKKEKTDRADKQLMAKIINALSDEE